MQRNLTRDTRGQVSTEFVILMVCILVGGIALWKVFGETVLRMIEG